MMTGFRSILAAAALVCTVGLASQAQAVAIGIDPDGAAGAASMTYADLWTMMTDTGLSVGFVAGKSVPPGAPYDINFIYQGRVGTMEKGGASVTPTWLNNGTNGWQLTKVTNILETVTLDTTYINTNPGPQHNHLMEYATFASGANGSKMEFWLGALPPAANPNLVSNYQSGLHLFDAILVNQSSSFTFDVTAGTGTGSYDTNWAIDFESAFTQASIAAGYVDFATNLVFGDHFTGTTNIPSFFNPRVMWDGTLASTGIKLKVDGSQNFTTVPEPSTFLLLGAGLAALGFARRNRKN